MSFDFKQSISKEIFKKKYMLHEEESVDEVFRGIAKDIASVEKRGKRREWEAKFYEEMSSGRFIPAGRIMANSRTYSKLRQYNNCFTIDIEDSMDGIYNSLKEDALISKTGGGVGFNVSKLRPKGDSLSTGGEASGVISFLKVFNESAKIIMTGGARRSAHIAILNVDHPEIEDFITVKQGDSNKELTQFNISVGITNDFMLAVKEDYDWDLKFEGKVYKTVKARYLYDLIAKNSFTHNEPGVFYLDRANRDNNAWYDKLTEIVTTNPCQPKWAKVLTPNGIRKFEEIAIGDKIWSKEGWTTIINKWSTGVKPVYKFSTNSSIFYGTENHKVVSGGQKIEVGEAESIESITGPVNTNLSLSPNDIMDGIVLGDGSVHKSSKNLVYLFIGENDSDYFSSEVSSLIGNYRPALKETAYEITTSILPEELLKTYERRVPDRFLYGSPSKAIGFLRGLYTANGSVVGNRITLKGASKGLIEDVQIMLSSIGIRSYITTNKPSEVKFDNGTYLCKESYDLNISTDREKFVNLIGFIQDYKNEKINIVKSSRIKTDYEITEKTFVSEEEVFDITVDNESHTYWTQGCNVSNCGEIPMGAYSLCDLGAIKLSSFVRYPFTDSAYFDSMAFKDTIEVGVRFLDNVLDATDYPLEKIKKFSKKYRRIGLGFTALGDTFAMMGMKYGSQESLAFSEELAQNLRNVSYRTSAELAKEKGKFPACDRKKILKGGVVKKLPPVIQRDISKYGLRNIALNTIAPTGTISFTVGQNCSSGIEPIFSLEYTRNIRTGRGDETISEKVYDEAWMDYQSIHGETSVEDAPTFFSTTLSIKPEDAIEVQAVFQNYIDHSISKCVAKGTILNTSAGSIPIETLAKYTEEEDTFFSVRDHIEILDEDGNPQRIKNLYYNGKKNGVSLRFNNGKKLIVSENHKFKTIDGEWVRAVDIEVGDEVLYRLGSLDTIRPEVTLSSPPDFNNSKKLQFPKSLTPDLGKWLGMYLADGDSSLNSISLTEKDKTVQKVYIDLTKSLFGITPKVYLDSRTGANSIRINSRPLKKFMDNWVGSGCRGKIVPDEIMRSPSSVQRAFLEGLTLDGYKKAGGLVIYEGYSEDIQTKVGTLLSSLGLRYSLHTKKVSGTGEIAYGVKAILRERLIIPIELHKRNYDIESDSAYSYKIKEDSSGSDIDTFNIPSSASEDYSVYCSVLRAQRRDGFLRGEKAKNFLGKDNLDIFLSKVKVTDKEYTEEVEMFDIEVENTHTYLIDGIVSHNTHNLAPGTTFEQYKDLFMMAYDKGLKGFTSFNPEGSMKGVLEHGDGKEGEIPVHIDRHHAPKRPKDLPCDIHEITVQGTKMIVLVGKLNGTIYEIFVDENKDKKVDVHHHKEGVIRKAKKGKYDLIIQNGEEKTVVEDLSQALDQTYASLARLISMSLRHGTPLQFVVDQLGKSKEFINFEKTVMRVIKKYIKEGEKVQSYGNGHECQECGEQLEFREGCLTCPACGWSKCN